MFVYTSFNETNSLNSTRKVLTSTYEIIYDINKIQRRFLAYDDK